MLLAVIDPLFKITGSKDIGMFPRDIPESLVATAKTSSQLDGNMKVGSSVGMVLLGDTGVDEIVIGVVGLDPVINSFDS